MPNALALLSPLDRKRIVRDYLSKLNDPTLLLICKLYSMGKSDKEVCKALRLPADTLSTLKKVIADGILEVMRG